MKRIKSYFFAMLICVSAYSYAADDAPGITHLHKVPSMGLSARVSVCMREHAWCLFALGLTIGYFGARLYVESIKPNPYEGPLKEAHERIAELEAALVKFDQIYRVLGPVLRSRG